MEWWQDAGCPRQPFTISAPCSASPHSSSYYCQVGTDRKHVGSSLEDPDPEPDPQDLHVYGPPGSDPLVRGADPDPSLIKVVNGLK